jgi:hypothetical protein
VVGELVPAGTPSHVGLTLSLLLSNVAQLEAQLRIAEGTEDGI